ncbi:sigma-70 family RNA polymerase sigma factor [Janibacter cremeus]|uniref:sigma-70 family RNA polymerase sigma factor n=1 Tax=Janibacter cremeus TaxID=1285192 RepID=UPI0023F85334|nr:sigma-70 family RNA polymerase sigma factor [Janibacter cremeus]WEV77519.1 sigma-70 family RNA polymerase sigma factor [Janibacter cremeus]
MDQVHEDDRTRAFEAERPRLVGLATRILRDHAEAEDIVQQAWLRLHGTDARIDSLPAWLTTVTSRLCLDRLKSRTPEPHDEVEAPETSPDAADEVALADTVGIALQVVIDRLTPGERVAFVLHDSFGFDFPTIAAVLDTTPMAARKLASRARAKVRYRGSSVAPHPSSDEPSHDGLSDWEIVDAFMAAAREGDFDTLLQLLAPDVAVGADAAAITLGSPERIDGRREVAEFFNGSAHAALPVLVGDRPGAAWFHRGAAKVLFDFTVADGRVTGITFRAEESVLAQVVRRRDTERRG